MDLSDSQRAFLEKAHGAAMITLRPDGTPHAVRVGVALVDGKLWSSGVPGRTRTRHLRRDPRATVFVFEQGFGYLTIESQARIIDGPQAAELNLRLFQVMQSTRPNTDQLMWNGKPLGLDEFLEAMRAEQRLIYEFEPLRAYGLYQDPRQT
jgi:PPOX class probable F420-dependent enzyme